MLKIIVWQAFTIDTPKDIYLRIIEVLLNQDGSSVLIELVFSFLNWCSLFSSLYISLLIHLLWKCCVGFSPDLLLVSVDLNELTISASRGDTCR